MKNFKIIISPSKTFNKNALVTSVHISTMFLEDTINIFQAIRNIKEKDIQNIYGVSNKIAKEVLGFNKAWNTETYKAIDLYGGMVFKELKITKENITWVNDHILILDALYGIVRPMDYISKYRLDFKVKLKINLKDLWKDKINNYLKDYKIYSLSSREFTDLLTINFTEIKTDKDIKQIKKARGIKLNELIQKG